MSRDGGAPLHQGRHGEGDGAAERRERRSDVKDGCHEEPEEGEHHHHAREHGDRSAGWRDGFGVSDEIGG